MAKIEIRNARSSDINQILELDHSVESDQVFQIDQKRDGSILHIQIQQIHLPRSLTLDYLTDLNDIKNNWQSYDLFLIAFLNSQPVAYLTGVISDNHASLYISNIVVDSSVRHQGIASTMIMASIAWGDGHEIKNYLVIVSPKNHPGISFLKKMGFSLCGYNEFHFPRNQMAFYFGYLR